MANIRGQVEAMMGLDEDDLPVSSGLVNELEALSSKDLREVFFSFTGYRYTGQLFVHHIDHIGDILPRCDRGSIEWIMGCIQFNIQMVLFRVVSVKKPEAIRIVLMDDVDDLADALHKLRRGELA